MAGPGQKCNSPRFATGWQGKARLRQAASGKRQETLDSAARNRPGDCGFAPGPTSLYDPANRCRLCIGLTKGQGFARFGLCRLIPPA